MIYIWRNPIPEFRRAARERQWWRLALGLAALISVPTYKALQLRKPRPGMPPVSDVAFYWMVGGLVVAGFIIIALLVASIPVRRDRAQPVDE